MEELMAGLPELEHYLDVDNFATRSLLRKLQSVTVRHRQTCTCGRTLVNTYYRDPGTMATPQQRKDAWKCKKCWDRKDEVKKKYDEYIAEFKGEMGEAVMAVEESVEEYVDACEDRLRNNRHIMTLE